MICENCNNEHDGSYGSGRFCSKGCAKRFSSKKGKDNKNRKISETLFKYYHNGLSKQEYIQSEIAEKHASYERENEAANLMDLSSRTISKIINRMNIPCSLCGWNVNGVCGDIHHIIERKNGGSNDNSNLTYVCPNCHRLIHSGKIDKCKLITFEDQIGDEWKKYYYVKNGSIYEK